MWDARDWRGYFSLCAPEAVFIDERRDSAGRVTRDVEGVEQSRRSAEAIFAKIASFRETSAIDRIAIASDGQSATVWGHERATFSRGSQRRERCAATETNLVLRGGRALLLQEIDRGQACPKPTGHIAP